MKLKNLITFTNCIKTICIIGSFIQIKYIFTRYYEFDYTTLTSFDIPNQTILADLVISVNPMQFINHSKLMETFPKFSSSFQPYKSIKGLNPINLKNRENLQRELKNGSYIWELAKLFSKLKVNQVAEILYQPQELVRQILVRSVEETEKDVPNFDFTDRCQLRSFFKSIYFYIVIACTPFSDKPIVGSSIVSELSPGQSDFFALLLNHEILADLETIRIAFIKPNSSPNLRKIKWISFRVDSKPAIYMVQYYGIKISQLASPYTDCVNYQDEGYENQASKLDSCLNNLSLTILGRPFHACVLPSFINTTFVSFDAYLGIRNNLTYRQLVDEILSICEARTSHHDCLTVNYISRSSYSVSSLSPLTAIITDLTRFPNLSIIYRPKWTAIDSLISVGGILGFWFGFAFNIHLPKLTSSLLTKINQRNKKTNTRTKKISKRSKW